MFRRGKVVVWGADTLTGKKIEIEADLVVLAAPWSPARTAELAKRLKMQVDRNGFLTEVHPKLRPVESADCRVLSRRLRPGAPRTSPRPSRRPAARRARCSSCSARRR